LRSCEKKNEVLRLLWRKFVNKKEVFSLVQRWK
jgi:hypothetical protein